MQQIVQITLQDDGYCDNNKYLYKNQDYLDGKTTEKECVACIIEGQGSSDLWYIYQKDNVNYHICAVDQGCPNTFKYETTGRQCVTSCKDTDPSYYVVIPVNSNNRSQCQSICTIIYSFEDAVWYQRDDGEKLCTRSGTCPTDEQYQYLLQDTMECQAMACDKFGDKYKSSSGNSMICEPVDLCSRDGYYYPNEPSNYINVCIEECPKVWYFLELSMSSGKVTYRICDLNKNDISCPPTLRNETGVDSQTQQLIKLSNRQCVQFCKYSEDQTYIIESLNNKSLCITSCGYSQVDGQQVENVYYTGDNYELKCSSQWKCPPPENPYNIKYYQNRYCALNCSGNFVYQLTDDGYKSYVCSDTCMYYINPNDNNNKYCMKDNDCDNIGEQYPYVKNTNDRRECVSACKNKDQDSVWILQDDEKRYCQSNASCNNSSRQCADFEGQKDDLVCPSNTYKYNETAEGETLYSCKVDYCSYTDYFYVNIYDKDNHECIESCSGVWYYYPDQSTTQYKICDQTNTDKQCPPNNPVIDISDTSYNYLINLIKLNDQQCVASCKDQPANNYLQNITIDQKSTYTCLESCGDQKTWYLNQGDNLCTGQVWCPLNMHITSVTPQTYECITCTTDNDKYKYIQQSICVEACDISKYPYLFDNTCEQSCIILIERSFVKYQETSPKQCVSDCSGKKWNPLQGEKMCSQDTQCTQQQRTVKDDDNECADYCSYLIINNEVVQSYYNQENVCLSECTEKYAYPYEFNTTGDSFCNITCTYYIGSVRKCTSDGINCDDGKYQYTRDQQATQCVDSCKGSLKSFVSIDKISCEEDCGDYYWSFDQNKEKLCKEQCDQDEYYLQTEDEDKQCIDQEYACPTDIGYVYYKDTKKKICRINRCVNYEWFYQDKYDEDAWNCIKDCGENNLWFEYRTQYMFNNKKVFICDVKNEGVSCPPDYSQQGEQYEFVKDLVKQTEDRQCVSTCVNSYHQYKYIDANKQNYCIEDCEEKQVYYLKGEEFQCVNQEQCPPEGLEELKYTIDSKQCIENCLYSGQFIYVSNDFECEEDCGPRVWRQIDNQRVCQDQIKCNETEYLIFEDYNRKCVDEKFACPEKFYVYSYYKDEENRECIINHCSNPDGFYINEYQDQTLDCYDECYNGYVWYLYNIDENNKVKVCIIEKYQCPPNQQELYTLKYIGENKQCTQFCYDNLDGQYLNSKLLGGSCQASCDGIWIQVGQEKKCYNNESDCSNRGNDKKIYVEYLKQCIGLEEECPEYEEIVYTKDLEANLCKADPCTVQSNYVIMKEEDQNECIQQCTGIWFKHTLENDKQVKVCINEKHQCPPTEEVEQQTSKLVRITIDNQCVEKCYDSEKYQINTYYGNGCVDQQGCGEGLAWYKYDEQTQFCTINTSCYQLENYQLVQIYNKFEENKLYQCTEKCDENTAWQQLFYQKLCTTYCTDYDIERTIEMSNYQCSELTVENCKQQYHIEQTYMNTECQYFQDASDCSQFQNTQYSEYIYIKEDSKLCTICDEEGYEKKTENDINKCVVKSSSQDKLSGGAIAGIVIGVIIVVAVVVIVSIMCCKKNKKASSDHEMQRNDKIE